MRTQKNTKDLIFFIYGENGCYVVKHDFNDLIDKKYVCENISETCYKNNKIVLLLDDNEYIEYVEIENNLVTRKNYVESYYYKEKIIHNSKRCCGKSSLTYYGFFCHMIYLKSNQILIYSLSSNNKTILLFL